MEKLEKFISPVGATFLKYIQRQKEHHKNISFQEEFRALMKEHGIDFDEKYVWD